MTKRIYVRRDKTFNNYICQNIKRKIHVDLYSQVRY